MISEVVEKIVELLVIKDVMTLMDVVPRQRETSRDRAMATNQQDSMQSNITINWSFLVSILHHFKFQVGRLT